MVGVSFLLEASQLMLVLQLQVLCCSVFVQMLVFEPEAELGVDRLLGL